MFCPVLSNIYLENTNSKFASTTKDYCNQLVDKLKIKNVTYKLGNGIDGWEGKIFFDAIIVSAASEEISPKLLENLKINGQLIFPKKYSFENQKLILLKKIGENNFKKEKLFDVKFVHLLNNSAQY